MAIFGAENISARVEHDYEETDDATQPPVRWRTCTKLSRANTQAPSSDGGDNPSERRAAVNIFVFDTSCDRSHALDLQRSLRPVIDDAAYCSVIWECPDESTAIGQTRLVADGLLPILRDRTQDGESPRHVVFVGDSADLLAHTWLWARRTNLERARPLFGAESYELPIVRSSLRDVFDGVERITWGQLFENTSSGDGRGVLFQPTQGECRFCRVAIIAHDRSHRAACQLIKALQVYVKVLARDSVLKCDWEWMWWQDKVRIVRTEKARAERGTSGMRYPD